MNGKSLVDRGRIRGEMGGKWSMQDVMRPHVGEFVACCMRGRLNVHAEVGGACTGDWCGGPRNCRLEVLGREGAFWWMGKCLAY